MKHLLRFYTTIILYLCSYLLYSDNSDIERQLYRKLFSDRYDINYLLNLDINELETLTEELKNIKKNKEQKKISLILSLLLYSQNVQRINLKDYETIKEYLKKAGISIDKNIGLEEIKKLFTGKGNKFIRKMLKTASFLIKNNNSGMIRYQTYNYLGPFLETYKVICSFENKKDREIYNYLKKYKSCKLKKKFSGGVKIKDLLEKIKSGDGIKIGNYDEVASFVSKIILQELISSELKKKDLIKFYEKIINKTDYSEFTCGKFCNVLAPNIKREYDKIVFHNGYQLLNSIKGANRLESFFGTERVIKKPWTTGIECSLFIQRALERMNIAKIKGRMKTSDMDKKLRDITVKIPLNKENQLKKGDIVKFKGHTFVFLGFKKINNRYYGVTIEAVGGNIRSVGVFYRDFYKTEVGGFNRLVTKDKKIKSVKPDERYFIYRIK